MRNDDYHQTRRFAAGAVTFDVRCPSEAVKDAIESLFVDLGEGLDAETATTITVSFGEDGLLEMLMEGGRSFVPQRFDGAMASLVTAVTRLALDAEPNNLHVHCAALSLEGKGVLISAASGTGKTTLAAALATRGWTYLSDEVVSLASGSSTVSGFPKPMVIKPGGSALVPELRPACVTLGAETGLWLHVPVSALFAQVQTELTPAAIVILHRAADGSTDSTPVAMHIHPADAVVALMGQTMDAERFGTDAMVVLAHLAARCRCVSLPVGPLNAATGVLEELVLSPVEASAVFQFSEQANSNAAAHGWQISEAISSVLLGDRVVVHDTVGGAVVALDEAGSAVWQTLKGSPPGWWHPDAMKSAATSAFLEQLAAYGILESLSTDPKGP